MMLGVLTFAGPNAISAVFSLVVTGQVRIALHVSVIVVLHTDNEGLLYLLSSTRRIRYRLQQDS
jgi:hypothetical protein